MEKVINLLYEIEEKADKILNRTSDDKAKLNNELNAKIKAFDEELEKETTRKLGNLRHQMDAEVSNELAQLKQNTTSHLENLEKNFKEHGNDYADEIFNRIITI